MSRRDDAAATTSSEGTQAGTSAPQSCVPSDRFICRREGHKPALVITKQNASHDPDATYLTTCVRCGKVYEEAMPRAS